MNNPFSHLSVKDKMFFAQHMAIMSRSGMQILDILKTLKHQATSRTFKKVFDGLIDNVKNGQFLSEGLAKHHALFGDYFINIVHVGEISGTLAENLEYLAESLKRKRELEGKVKGALVYPIIILIATSGLTAALTFFIFPKILPIFKSLKVDLPLITKVFIKVSTFMINHGVALFLTAFAVAVGAYLLTRIRPIKYAWHRLLLFLPIVGTLVQNYNVIAFVRSVSMLLKSGVKIVQALEITSNSATNLVYRAALKKVAAAVATGDQMSKHLALYPKLFPVIFTEMIAVGETTGRLTDTGVYLADYYETELDNSTKSLSNILEPLLLVTMGAIVTFVALAIILPIYEISSNIKSR